MSERGTVQDGRSGPEIQELYMHRAVRQPAKASAAIKGEAGEELDFTRLQQREKTLGHC